MQVGRLVQLNVTKGIASNNFEFLFQEKKMNKSCVLMTGRSRKQASLSVSGKKNSFQNNLA